MTLERKQFRLDGLKAKGDGEGTFAGRAAVYGNVDLGGDVIVPGAFTESLQERGHRVPLLKQHDHSSAIGWGVLSDGPEALDVEGSLIMGLDDAKQEWIRVKAGLVGGLSIGYMVPDGGARYVRGVRELTKVMLHEVSLVTFPMNEEARITGIKADAARLASIVDEMKAGRMLSAANLRLVQDCFEAMSAAGEKLAALLAAATDAADADKGAETDEEKAAREAAEQAAAAAAETETKSLDELLAGLRGLAGKSE